MQHSAAAALFVVFLVRPARGACEEWCAAPCTDLNGDVTRECNSCPNDGYHGCYAGAEGYDDWQQRSEEYHNRVAVGPNGETLAGARTEDVVERTKTSLVYMSNYYDVANKYRDSDLKLVGPMADMNEFEVDLPIPVRTERHCEVHSCVLLGSDGPCAEGRAAECSAPRGHLRPIGEQFETMLSPTEHDVRADGPLNATHFWQKFVSKLRPVVLRGGAAAASDLSLWTDDSLRAEASRARFLPTPLGASSMPASSSASDWERLPPWRTLCAACPRWLSAT